ncbi:hypothetical protein J1605_015771 [Eschrichtius robustus]|uniref:Collectrin-like domain-containing protein n=1 Tax=Eschrichtius robustus TaxID=9764 RepID=A0AB34GC36_ESCRO|nr:hypothetical protein J1605_015771 [Eschrichtius robustus]
MGPHHETVAMAVKAQPREGVEGKAPPGLGHRGPADPVVAPAAQGGGERDAADPGPALPAAAAAAAVGQDLAPVPVQREAGAAGSPVHGDHGDRRFRARAGCVALAVPRYPLRMNRNRINNAFFLNDQTLEFLRIPSTLAPPTDPSVPIWIIIFGVVFCIVIVATMLLILSGIRQRRRENKGPSEMEDTEDKWENTITIENGIPCDPLDMKRGHVNDAFVTEDERLTPL